MASLSYIAIFLCATVIEVGWISAVRSVTNDRMWSLVLMAVSMQAISNVSTLILVSNGWTAVASIAGAGFGAILGMRYFSQSASTVDAYTPSDTR